MSLDPSPEFIGQNAHWCFAAFCVLASAHLWGMHVARLVSLAGVGAAAVKEFWWDLRYESPSVSGGWRGTAIDFAFYVVGIVGALIVLAL